MPEEPIAIPCDSVAHPCPLGVDNSHDSKRKASVQDGAAGIDNRNSQTFRVSRSRGAKHANRLLTAAFLVVGVAYKAGMTHARIGQFPNRRYGEYG